jgi:NAD(P)-dependent dehydrogenase (short-subunit alcohol dehydrogenase family)
MEGWLIGVLDGKVAIVTGTSRAVGVGIAHEFLRAGASLPYSPATELLAN